MEGNSVRRAPVMAEGTVRSFDNVVGKGLIAREGATDVYVNRAAIKELGPRTLVTGDRVRFHVIEGLKGPCAASVHKLHAADSTGY
jgi:CspA family cold shock protein